jgi:hypothetical protein
MNWGSKNWRRLRKSFSRRARRSSESITASSTISWAMRSWRCLTSPSSTMITCFVRPARHSRYKRPWITSMPSWTVVSLWESASASRRGRPRDQHGIDQLQRLHDGRRQHQHRLTAAGESRQRRNIGHGCRLQTDQCGVSRRDPRRILAQRDFVSGCRSSIVARPERYDVTVCEWVARV